MNTPNVKEHIKTIKMWKSVSNEHQLKIFDLLYLIETNEMWKQQSYYEGLPELRKYTTMAFKDLLIDVFDMGYIVYTRMKELLTKIEGWRELYCIHGWEHNMACFVNLNKIEKVTVLKAVDSGDKRNMANIWRHHYPKEKNKLDAIKNGWKIKYEKVVMENKQLKEKIKELEKQAEAVQKIFQVQKAVNQ